jgi:serine/threonine protein kinase
MNERISSGSRIGEFLVGERVHAGGMGHVYRASRADGADPDHPLAVKVPGIGHAEPAIGVVGFEMELLIHPALTGPHVPKFVAAGSLEQPYLVMEWIEGESLNARLAHAPLAETDVAAMGAAIADALHDLHLQQVVHHDLKPENVLLRPDGTAALIDFGCAHHARFPDLLGEEMHFAVGSSAYVSPEQLRNERGDPRSDIFALGALLYELATGEPPFGAPQTLAGMRDRLWRLPTPPRAVNPSVTPWLQEVILRCLETDRSLRYQSAAHVAFDLRNTQRVALSARAHRTESPGFAAQVGRWWRARAPAAIAARRAPSRVSVILVAVDTTHPDDVRQPSIQWTTRQVLSLDDEFRLMCVSVISAPTIARADSVADSASGRQLEHLGRLRRWVQPLALPDERLSLHVIESPDPAGALLDLARRNHVDLIVLGAPGPDERAFAWWRSVASGVTAGAHCSVHVVRVPQRSAVSAAIDDGPEEPATGSA